MSLSDIERLAKKPKESKVDKMAGAKVREVLFRLSAVNPVF